MAVFCWSHIEEVAIFSLRSRSKALLSD